MVWSCCRILVNMSDHCKDARRMCSSCGVEDLPTYHDCERLLFPETIWGSNMHVDDTTGQIGVLHKYCLVLLPLTPSHHSKSSPRPDVRYQSRLNLVATVGLAGRRTAVPRRSLVGTNPKHKCPPLATAPCYPLQKANDLILL
jgi:hypothetical protein